MKFLCKVYVQVWGEYEESNTFGYTNLEVQLGVIWNNAIHISTLWTCILYFFWKHMKLFCEAYIYVNNDSMPSHTIFLKIFRYYYHFFVVWLHIEVRSVPTRQLKVSCISGAWATIEHRSLNMFFCVIFWILLEVRTVEVRFSFPKQVEVQLNDRKYQIFLKILENHRWQLIWCLLHVKNLLGGL